MNLDRYLPIKLKEFFQKNQMEGLLKMVTIVVLRRDGFILFSSQQEFDKNVAGALLGGVWQAAWALTHMVPQEGGGEQFRLSFDTSSKGFYMLPVQICHQEYYLSTIFKNQTNPAQMKSKVRDLCHNLSAETTHYFKSHPSKSGASGTPLFKDISDAEMDSLFSFAGSEVCPS